MCTSCSMKCMILFKIVELEICRVSGEGQTAVQNLRILGGGCSQEHEAQLQTAVKKHQVLVGGWGSDCSLTSNSRGLGVQPRIWSTTAVKILKHNSRSWESEVALQRQTQNCRTMRTLCRGKISVRSMGWPLVTFKLVEWSNVLGCCSRKKCLCAFNKSSYQFRRKAVGKFI